MPCLSNRAISLTFSLANNDAPIILITIKSPAQRDKIPSIREIPPKNSTIETITAKNPGNGISSQLKN